METVSASGVRRVFGDAFADALQTLPPEGWQGPVTSGFGLHLVALAPHDVARTATLAEARADVERDLTHARLQQANAAFYDRLRAKYAVRIEGSDHRAAADPAG